MLLCARCSAVQPDGGWSARLSNEKIDANNSVMSWPVRKIGVRPASRLGNKARRLHGLKSLLVCIVFTANLLGIAHPVNATALASSSLYLRDVLPELRASVGANAATTDQYRVEMTFDPATGSFEGHEQVKAFNPAAKALDGLTFLLPANASSASYASATRIESATVDDVPVEHIDDKISMLGAAFDLSVDGGLATGASVDVDIHFSTRIRPLSDMYSEAGQDWTTQEWAVDDWFPVVANYEAEQGWLTRDISASFQVGGKFDYYDVTITTPKAYELISSGSEISAKEKEGDVAHRIIAGPARGFALALDTDFRTVSTTVGDTRLNIAIDTYFSGVEDAALEMAQSALADYSGRYGVYPFRELDILIAPWVPAAGIAFSGFVWISQPYKTDHYEFAVDENDLELIDFDVTISHEIGHQWWGVSVSSNMMRHDFLVEGLTECMAIIHIARAYGATAANKYVRDNSVGLYFDFLSDYDDEAVDQTAIDSPSGASPAILYGKAPIALLAVRDEIGPPAFESAIASYTIDHAFGLTGPADLQNAFEAASGEDLDDFWNEWIESDDISRGDVNDLLSDTIFKRDEVV